jgi:glutamate racemase
VNKETKKSGKIGIFDSGFGGLSILKKISNKLPQYNYIYLGDSARAPYGDRSQEEIFRFTKQGVKFLFDHGSELVILACNSASAEALRKIQQNFLKGKYKDRRVLGVIVPASEAAVANTKNKIVSVIGTTATVSSKAFEREIRKLDRRIKVYESATPLLASMVESGDYKSVEAKKIIEGYIKKAVIHSPDVLILGCTHYEILMREIKRHAKDAQIVSEGSVVAQKLKDYLCRHGEIESKLSKDAKLEFYTTKSKSRFDRLGSIFFGKRISAGQASL